jgi:isopenicillin N synthase-like dioxygenase
LTIYPHQSRQPVGLLLFFRDCRSVPNEGWKVAELTSIHDAAAHSLVTQGYALVRDETSLMPLVRAAFSEGQGFFDENQEHKLAAASPSKLEGYRPIGTEFSETPEQPDLCESFSVWGWNSAEVEVRAWSTRNRLHGAMTLALPGFAGITNAVLEALRLRLNRKGQKIVASEASYLQINHYRPRHFDREFLQETHEDGHVLTIHKATGSGLEYCAGDHFAPLMTKDNGFLLLPGSLLTLITGGVIPPLFHRVRNDHSSAVRQSLLYFVNPSLVDETAPWIDNHTNRGVSIRSVALSCIGAR